MTRSLLAAVLASVLAGAMPAQAYDPVDDSAACAGQYSVDLSSQIGLQVPAKATVSAANVRCLRALPIHLGPDPIPEPPVIPPVCLDGEDNDEDGVADFPLDPGCDGPLDPDERPECSDELDNDGDWWADYPYDPECSSPNDPSETACGPTEPLACGSPYGFGYAPPCPAYPLPPGLVHAHWVEGMTDGVQLEWEEAILEPAAYLIYRATLGNPVLEPLVEPMAGVSGTVTTYFDDSALFGETYAYWVTSAGPGCESPPSPPAPVGPGIPDTGQCLNLGYENNPPPPSVDPEYKGTECLPL